MQVKLVIFPSEDGLNVVIWGQWAEGSMRVRRFETRTTMIDTLRALGLIAPEERSTLENFTFEDSCPLFSGEVSDQALEEHGFSPPGM